MTRVPLQLWAEVSEDGKRCGPCHRLKRVVRDGVAGFVCREHGDLFHDTHGAFRDDACIAAEQAAREAATHVTPVSDEAFAAAEAVIEAPLPKAAAWLADFDPPGREYTCGDAIGLRREAVRGVTPRDALEARIAEWSKPIGDVPPSDGGARQMDEHERMTPEDVARITAMYERVCSENERLREQADAMAQRYNVVLDKEHALVTSLHAENARLREREARVRALCKENGNAYGSAWGLAGGVLYILDDDGKDGEG